MSSYVEAIGGGGIKSVSGGKNISIDNTDPVNPVINLQNEFETVSKNYCSNIFTTIFAASPNEIVLFGRNFFSSFSTTPSIIFFR